MLGKESVMKKLEKLSLAAITVALVAPVLAGAVPVSRPADGAAQIQHVASYVSPKDLKDFDSGNGRAGSAVGNAPAEKPDRKTDPDGRVEVATPWHGGAGGSVSLG